MDVSVNLTLLIIESVDHHFDEQVCYKHASEDHVKNEDPLVEAVAVIHRFKVDA